MANPALANYAFLPWLQRGAATGITFVDGSGPAPPRVSVDVELDIGPGPDSTGDPVTLPLLLFGPGDVHNLDSRVVVRTWPRPNVFDAEPNYFPLIEMVPSDLPWRFTPARANPSDRLRPWLCLIVLRDNEIEKLQGPTADQPLTRLTVKSAASLPPLDQSWAWAHVQVSGQDHVDPATAAGVLDDPSGLAVARLICPRRLDQSTAYNGFLVPALGRAVLAGLGQDPGATDGLAPAWKATDTSVLLPVYYQWRFQTGPAGDFESLARLIVPRPTPATVGTRPMDVSSPGQGLAAAASTPLNLEGALRSLESQSTPWDASERTQWTTNLSALLNLPSQRLATAGHLRVVTPPLYGRWYAARTTVDPTQQPPWFQDLNVDPRLRTAGGLGTLVVQTEQQQFLASAWAQVGPIREANEKLRQAQLARETSVRLYQRHVAVRPTQSLMAFAAPVFSRIKASPTTIAAVVRQSPLAIGVFEPAFRRLARTLGPVGRRFGLANPAKSTLLDRLNQGALVPAPPPPLPSTLITPARAGRSLAPPWLNAQLVARLRGLSHLQMLEVGLVLVFAAVGFLLRGGHAQIAAQVAKLGFALIAAAAFAPHRLEDIERRVALRDGVLTSASVRSAPARPGFVPVELTTSAVPPTPPVGHGADSPATVVFRAAIADVLDEINAPPAPGPVLRSLSLETLGTKVLDALEPRKAFAAAYADRLQLAKKVSWKSADPIDPVMAAPEFPDPMYLPLYNLSPNWLMPGLDQLLQNTATLLKTNERFIESYMVGLNHEMARELLFNEYPTDQRGTYFRQFWDSSGYAAAGVDPETLKDIAPINTWRRAAALGENSSRVTPPGGDFLVLMLRAELLHRYPNMIVYAARAKWDQGARVVSDDPNDISKPVFWGQLGVGCGFWGFNLTKDQVVGTTDPSGDPGWFFALKEHVSEPRFGLEPAVQFGGTPTAWQLLSWADLAPSSDALAQIAFVDLDADLPDTSKVSDPAHAVWHADKGTGPAGARASDLAYITLREPIRLLIHASRMISP